MYHTVLVGRTDSFDIGIAEVHGIEAAIIYQKISEIGQVELEGLEKILFYIPPDTILLYITRLLQEGLIKKEKEK